MLEEVLQVGEILVEVVTEGHQQLTEHQQLELEVEEEL
jgi:hypothetical protein